MAWPDSHAILAGIMLAVTLSLQTGLHDAGHWETRIRHLRALQQPFTRMIA